MPTTSTLDEHEHPILLSFTLWVQLMISLVWVGTASVLMLEDPDTFIGLLPLPLVIFTLAVDTELIVKSIQGKPVEVTCSLGRKRENFIIHAPWKVTRYFFYWVVTGSIFLSSIANVIMTLDERMSPF